MELTEGNLPPPHPALALTEVHRVVVEVLALTATRKLLRKAPHSDGHPVMVLPGFMGSDGYSAPFRRWLTGKNLAVHGWGLGRNLGPRNGVLEAMQERLLQLADTYGKPVSLVGHSLGGIYARELARQYPEAVRQVISLGSPFGKGRMTASYPGRLFTALNPPEELPISEEILHEDPPVPTTAIYSKGDGIVNWRTTCGGDGHGHSQSIEVHSSHCGMTMNPTVWFLVAERLAQSADGWQPFERRSWRNLLYPRA